MNCSSQRPTSVPSNLVLLPPFRRPRLSCRRARTGAPGAVPSAGGGGAGRQARGQSGGRRGRGGGVGVDFRAGRRRPSAQCAAAGAVEDCRQRQRRRGHVVRRRRRGQRLGGGRLRRRLRVVGWRAVRGGPPAGRGGELPQVRQAPGEAARPVCQVRGLRVGLDYSGSWEGICMTSVQAG